MRFDLADLSLFRHVVEAGSITHGAERAHLALAAASTRIRNMEEALGAPLLVRGRHGVATDPGRPDAAAACPHHAGAGRAAARGPRLLRRRARRAGPGAVQHQCADRIPARDAELVPGGASQRQRRSRGAAVSDEIVGLIAEGVGDIGIVAGTVDTSRLTTYPFRTDRFVLVVARDHPFARRSKRRFRRRARPRVRRTRTLQRRAALLCRPSQPARPHAAAAGAVAQLRHGVPSGRARRRRRHRAGDHGAPGRQGDGDQGRSTSPTPGRCASSPSASAISQALPPFARQLVEHMRARRN